MTPRAITIRLAEPRDAQAIAMMSRDFIESGLGWKYDASRVMRAIRDRETLAVVACDAKSGAEKDKCLKDAQMAHDKAMKGSSSSSSSGSTKDTSSSSSSSSTPK